MEIEQVSAAENGGGIANTEAEAVAEVGAGLVRGGMYLVWEDLTVMVPNFGSGPTRRLLNGVTGYAEPGRILAIMGPSGSGKSTLLDALAGRLSGNIVMTGNVLLNGKKRNLDYGGVGYVTQENIMLGTLTVRETITYSARLRLPSNMTNEEITGIIEGAIMEMGLQDCADQLIGNWHLRGISGGEKKRLSIALEILTRPQILFFDEPTSGLDSAAAFFVVKILKNIACDGRTIISSIHQPSSEVFAVFDDLFLLSGGETVYFGDAKFAAKFFAEAGFPCPTRRSPSDHFLQCINSDFEIITEVLMESQRIRYVSDVDSSYMQIYMKFISNKMRLGVFEIQNPLDPIRHLPTSEIKGMLIKKYQCSEYATRARGRIQGISSIEGLEFESKNGSQAKWSQQISILTQRSMLNMSRDFGYYWLRIAIYIILSICVGSIFFDVGKNYTAIYARGSCAAFISGFMTFMSIGGFPSFIEEMKVFYRERLNGHYGVAVYILSNFLSSLPFLTVMSFATSSITYYMVKFRPGISHFIYASLDLTSSIAVIESCMMMIASMVPNFMTGVIIGAGYLGIMMMTSGYFRLIPEMPKAFWRYPIAYINHSAWALQGAYKNDLIGLEFEPFAHNGPKLKGNVILKTMLGINLDHSKWWDLAAVVAILICYRVMFFAILKFREKASPVFRSVYAKRTLHNLKKRPSFRKMSPFHSKRHQVLNSLSSQEGLNSPIQ